jgi:hypothetical protein
MQVTQLGMGEPLAAEQGPWPEKPSGHDGPVIRRPHHQLSSSHKTQVPSDIQHADVPVLGSGDELPPVDAVDSAPPEELPAPDPGCSVVVPPQEITATTNTNATTLMRIEGSAVASVAPLRR